MIKNNVIYFLMSFIEMMICISVAVFVMRLCLLSNVPKTMSLFFGIVLSLAANTYIKFRPKFLK